VIKVKVGTS